MPTHVYANNNEIASKASEGKSIAAFPDVCFSPPAPPVGPMPLPYPNTGECTNTDKGTSKVFIKDKMSGMEGDSNFSKSMGDESATQNFTKGMITSALQGKCYFGLWSMDVQMEGKGVPRHLDMVTHNHASQPGNPAAAIFKAEVFQKTMSLGGVYVSKLPKEINSEVIEIGLFFDGTGNDKYSVASNEGKTNIAYLHDAYSSWNGKEESEKNCFKIYIRGVGADGSGGVTYAGGGAGIGLFNGFRRRIKSLVSAVCLILLCNKKCCIKKIKFDIFGFSRGATLARNIAYGIAKNGVPDITALSNATSDITYDLRYFENNFRFKKNVNIIPEIRFLGIFDTVDAFLSEGITYEGSIAKKIDRSYAANTTHIIAKNEYRKCFSLVSDAESSVNVIKMIGAHADIGGGYGASNLAINFDFIKICSAKIDGRNIYDATFDEELEGNLKILFKLHYIDIIRCYKSKDFTKLEKLSAFTINNLWKMLTEKEGTYVKNNFVSCYGFKTEGFFLKKTYFIIDFFYPKQTTNDIRKISCNNMLNSAISKGVPISEHLLNKFGAISKNVQSESFEYCKEHVHISGIDDELAYSDLFCAQGNSYPKIVNFISGLRYDQFPKTRVNSRYDFKLAHAVADDGVRDVDYV